MASLFVEIVTLLLSKSPPRILGMFHVTNVYGPAAAPDKAGFISWLYNFDTSGIDDWIILGDFNLLRSPADRNMPGGCMNEKVSSNDLIHHLDLVEISF
jgi:hypothetical protein